MANHVKLLLQRTYPGCVTSNTRTETNKAKENIRKTCFSH